MTEDVLLDVEELSIEFTVGGSRVRAVDGVSFRIGTGEIVGLVGESGCGKSTLGSALLGLVPAPGTVTGGRVLFQGRDLASLSREEMRCIRGQEISLIVQDALSAMNPVTTVGEQVSEVLRDHQGGTRRETRKRVLEMLRRVELPRPEMNIDRYAHELSGGMQQRIAIAGALILVPKLLVADEPTTALDVTIEAQILRLLREVRASTGTSILLISHDLAAVAEVCDRVMVMYAGEIVEEGIVDVMFDSPMHPYTRALLASLPPLQDEPPAALTALPGQPPRPGEWVEGCRFTPRCPLRAELGNPARCVEEHPRRRDNAPQWAACHFVD